MELEKFFSRRQLHLYKDDLYCQAQSSVATVQDGLLWQRHLNKSSSGFLGAKRGRIGQRLIKPIESLHLAESLLPARSELVSPKKFRKG